VWEGTTSRVMAYDRTLWWVLWFLQRPEYFSYHHVTCVADWGSRLLKNGNCSSQKISLNILFTAVRTYKSPVFRLAFWVLNVWYSLVHITEHSTTHSITLKLNVTDLLSLQLHIFSVQKSNIGMDADFTFWHICGFFTWCIYVNAVIILWGSQLLLTCPSEIIYNHCGILSLL
jgi:hypothetical protein